MRDGYSRRPAQADLREGGPGVQCRPVAGHRQLDLTQTPVDGPKVVVGLGAVRGHGYGRPVPAMAVQIQNVLRASARTPKQSRKHNGQPPHAWR
jgi:hypothetical protein